MYNYNIKENLKPEEVLIYLRKSRADDPLLTVEEVLSKHETLLDEWVEKNLSSQVPPGNRFKEVVSGESIADRPEFQKVLKLVESPNIKAVLVVEVSRLGRPDMEEIGKLSKIFRYTNTLVITPMMTFNIANEYERDMFERELKRGNEYLEYTKKLLSRGREQSVKSGNYVCSRPLYGYDKITIIEDKRKCPTLAINEEQANIVRMIFNAYVNENVGTQVISNRLNDMGVKAPRGKIWSSDAIRTILENHHYIGMVKWNDRKAVLVVDNGEFRKIRPKTSEEEKILVKGKHEAIISEELFYAAQEKRGRAHRTISNKELRNPFASMLFCECGRAMAYRHSTRGQLNYRDPRLVCNGQRHCGNASCTIPEIMDFVVPLLRRKIADFEVEIKNGNEEANQFNEKVMKNLEKKLADINSRELSLWESQVDPDPANRMPAHIFQALTDKLVKEREETIAAIEKAKETIAAPVNYEAKRLTFQKALDALLDDEVSVADKNHLLKACIDRIDYQRDPYQRALGKGVGRQRTPSPMHLDVKLNMR
ncbi:MAG: recombinase family protein [Paludibacteraceae bacterium]|nr:recombinase family protein [Paludibacteraceae bacterium]